MVPAHPGDPVSPRIAGTPDKLRTADGRAFLQRLPLPADARERIEIALAMIDAIDAQIAPLERELRQLARRQTGCKALMGLYGMGELTSLVTLCELGDVGRLSASRKAVRMAGIDIGVHRSDRRSRVGKLNRQGSPHLRWALYEAALAACRPSSPDHADYLALKARGLSHTRASLTIARKLARRSLATWESTCWRHNRTQRDPLALLLDGRAAPPGRRAVGRQAPSVTDEDFNEALQRLARGQRPPATSRLDGVRTRERHMNLGATRVADDLQGLRDAGDDREAGPQAWAVAPLDEPAAGIPDDDRKVAVPDRRRDPQLALRLGVGVHDGVRGGLRDREPHGGDPFGIHAAIVREPGHLAAQRADSQRCAGKAGLERDRHWLGLPARGARWTSCSGSH
jgi:Transposase IS116/IS110/IS902 family